MDKLCVIIVIVLWSALCHSARSPIKLQENGYHGVTIAIGSEVAEDDYLVDRIKQIFTKASAVLFRATKYRAYFRNITVVLPLTWKKRQLPAPGGYESFEDANVIVDKPNPGYEDRPYTHQVAGCGKSGEYIHLTPGYLTRWQSAEYTYGAAAKAVVHEWGHLRWGLFDEYPVEGQRQFYRYRKEMLPVQCTKGLRGEMRNRKTFERCTFNKETMETDPDCRFYPFTENELTGSMMYYQYLPSIVDFCGEEERSSVHNLYAPTLQNRKCDSMTSWGVMRKHEDFVNDKNPPLDASTDTTPTFNLVQEREQIIILVLDVSKSMETDRRLQKMNQAARNYISTALMDGTYLGMVEFAGVASTLAPPTLIDSDETRLSLIAKLPTVLKPWTSIGAGLTGAINELSSGGRDPQGQHIVLITDGEETKDPCIKDLIPRLTELGIAVDTVGISKDAAKSLSGLSAVTGGNNYFYSGRDDDTSLDEALVLGASPGGINSSILIHSVASTDSIANVSFLLDSSLGRRTVVTINGAVANVQLLTPGGVDAIQAKMTDVVPDTVTQSLQITVKDDAEPGEWRILFTKSKGVPRIMIQSKPKLGDEIRAPVTLRSWTDKPKVKFTLEDFVIVYAEVLSGYSAVNGARVVAEVPTYVGTKQVFLKDSGVYPDLHRGDGIYSAAIFTKSFTANGRYPIRVRMTSVEETTVSQPVVKSMVAPVLRNGEVQRDLPAQHPEPVTNLMRTTSAGVMELTNYDNSLTITDKIPPSRIENLDVVKVFTKNNSILLQWTQPGDDYNVGVVDHYELRLAATYEQLRDNFSSSTNITKFMGSPWPITSHPESGNPDMRAVVDLSQFGNQSMTYVAMKSMDENHNCAPASNIEGFSFELPSMSAFQSGGDNNIGGSASDQTPLIVAMCLLLVMLILLALLAYKNRAAIKNKVNSLRNSGRISPTANGAV